MKIAGLIKTSLIDYPGEVAAVVFTQGCNFRCGFCHNPDLIPIAEGKITETEVLAFLASRKGKLDGVVITGGEPTLQSDSPDFTKKIKDLGLKVKLDTNGSNPKMLGGLIKGKLVDYVAMDIKNSPDKYQETCGMAFNGNIKESIELIKESGLDYEFRTTVLPKYHNLADFEELGKAIMSAKKYVVQGFRNEITFDKGLKNTSKFAQEDLLKIKKIMQKYVKEVEIRANI